MRLAGLQADLLGDSRVDHIMRDFSRVAEIQFADDGGHYFPRVSSPSAIREPADRCRRHGKRR